MSTCPRHSSRGFSVAVALAAIFVACASPISVRDGAVGESAHPLGASARPGMGATLYDGGVSFRVWAPFARRVWVAGDFNGWSWTHDELASEQNGNFSADVAGAARWQKYKYVIEGPDGNTFLRADPRAARMENSAGASIVHDPNAYAWQSSFQMPAWNELVIYELHVGTFARAPNRSVGTWRAAADKLDYLAGLGVNMIEVMPPAEFPGDLSWGYNPSEPMAPESAYGTPEDMKAFIDGAHARGIGVIVDVVFNHLGPNDLPMWCVDGNCLGRGGVYFYTDGRADTPWGPRPDYGRPEVRDYIKDTALMWLNEYHADGLRWDGTKFIRTTDGVNDLSEGWNLLQWVTSVAHAQPWKFQIAEDFGGSDWVTKSSGAGGAGFDSQWDGAFVHPLREAAIAAEDGWRSMPAVRDAITHAFNGQATQRVVYTESHDEVANGQQRLPEMIWPGNAASWAAKKRSTLAAAIAFTAPGVPLLFEGQEFLEDGWFQAERPLDWSKATTHAGITDLYRDLCHLRRNWGDHTRGLRGDHVNVYHVNDADKLIAYHRWAAGGPGDDVVIVANFSGRWFSTYRIGMPRGGLWHVRFNSDYQGYAGDFGGTQTLDTAADGAPLDGMGQSASFQLGPYSAVIFSQ